MKDCHFLDTTQNTPKTSFIVAVLAGISRERIKMELTEIQAKIVKGVYSNYHAGELPADEALNILEQLINGNEVCQSCLSIITDENPLIDTERYTANDYTGYCENCYDPTP
jgi:hypothetical protein